MKTARFLFVALATTLISSRALKSQQTFQKAFGTSANETQSNSAQLKQLANGDYILYGQTSLTGNGDYIVMKLDPSFNIIWTRTYGASGLNEEAADVCERSNGNILIAGKQSNNNVQVMLEIDPNGNQINFTQTGNSQDRIPYLYKMLDGSIMNYGMLQGWIPGSNNKVTLLHYDNAMNQTYRRFFDHNPAESFLGNGNSEMYMRPYGLTQLADSSMALVAQVYPYGFINQLQTRLMKLDKNGNLQWVKGYWGGMQDWVWSISEAHGGGFVFTGRTQSYGATGFDIFVQKCDANGNFQWVKRYGGAGNDESTRITKASDGGYIVAAKTNSFGFGGNDAMLLKIDANGNVQWAKTYGGTGDEVGSNVDTISGGYLLSGTTTSFGMGAGDFYIVKTDIDGNVNDTCFTDVTSILNVGNGTPIVYNMTYPAMTFNPPINVNKITNTVTAIDSTVCFVCSYAEFTSNDECVNDSVSFTNMSLNYDSLHWDFGDGNTSDTTDPVHTYSTAGTYTVQLIATNINQCPDTFYQTVNINPLPIVELGSDTVVCTGNYILDAGNIGSIYNWSNGDTSQTIMVNTSGTYWVEVTNPTGCFSTDSITILMNNLSLSTSSVDLLCNGDSSGSATVNASGGLSPYAYNWNTGGVNQTENNLAAGTYTVTVTDAGGCSSTIILTVNEPSALLLNPTSTVANCGEFDGTATVSVSGGTPNYGYLWSSGGNTLTEDSLAAGSYSVTVTDNNGCTAVDTQLVTQTNDLLANVISKDAVCPGDCNGSIYLEAITGTSPYTYQWETGQASDEITSLCPGNYLATITDAVGCSKIISTGIATSNTSPLAHFSATDNPTDILNTWIRFFDLSQGEVLGWNWTFYNNDGVEILGTANEANPNFTYPEVAGLYPVKLEVFNDAGCPDDTLLEVEIKGMHNLFVPNSFSPNGDGHNDFFFAKGIGIDENNYRMDIYYRWGELIFQSKNLNDFWDGTAKNKGGSEIVQQGVYVWKVLAKANYSEEKLVKIGTVTLIK